MADDHAAQELGVAVEILVGANVEREDGAGGIIDRPQQAPHRRGRSEPGEVAAIHQHQRPRARLAQPPCPMARRAAAVHRGQPCPLPQTPHARTRQLHALALPQLLGQVTVVEPRIALVDQLHDPLLLSCIPPARRGPAAVAVDQARHPGPAIGGLEPPELPHAQLQRARCFPIGDLPCQRGLHQARPPGLLAAHHEVSHGGTLSLNR